jgi:hypothetical protein
MHSASVLRLCRYTLRTKSRVGQWVVRVTLNPRTSLSFLDSRGDVMSHLSPRVRVGATDNVQFCSRSSLLAFPYVRISPCTPYTCLCMYVLCIPINKLGRIPVGSACPTRFEESKGACHLTKDYGDEIDRRLGSPPDSTTMRAPTSQRAGFATQIMYGVQCK